MTDEEMAYKHAEEYIMREDVITENDRVPFDNGYGFQTVSFEDEVKKGNKDGFLAGLKAGRPQWHDLRKNPNDLPKKPTEKMRVNETWVYVKFFDNTYGLVDKGALNNYSGAIAWCELPTFDKE